MYEYSTVERNYSKAVEEETVQLDYSTTVDSRESGRRPPYGSPCAIALRNDVSEIGGLDHIICYHFFHEISLGTAPLCLSLLAVMSALFRPFLQAPLVLLHGQAAVATPGTPLTNLVPL
jgi:hypothetical protein